MVLKFLKKPALSLQTRYVTFLVGLFMAALILITRQFHLEAILIPALIIGLFLMMQLYQEEVQFDTETGSLRKAHRLLGLQTKKKWEYDIRSITGVFVYDWKYTQSYTSQNSFQTVTDRGIQYRAFLKFDDDRKELLTSSSRRKWLASELEALSKGSGIAVKNLL